MPIVLAGPLGLRRSEVFARKWKDFILVKIKNKKTGKWEEHGKLIVNTAVVPVDGKLDYKETKNESSNREIVIPGKLLPIFKRHRGTNEALMCLNEKGLPLSVNGINSRFTTFLKNNGLTHYRFHDLRHYNGTLMMWLDIDPKKAATRFGHSSPVTLQKTYQHLVWDMDKEVAEKINQTL
jgi:integrase